MAFSSSDSPEEGLGVGDGVSGRLPRARSPGGAARPGEEGGEQGDGALSDDSRGKSASAEFTVGGGRGLWVKGDSLELRWDWLSSVKKKGEAKL